MNSQSVEKLNSILNGVSKAEFFFEQILAHYKIGPEFILECLSVFEILKLFYKFKKYAESRDRFFISSEIAQTSDPEEQKKEKHLQKLFFEGNQNDKAPKDTDKLKEKLSKILDRIKTQDNKLNTSVFQDTLGRSTKNMNIISNLPIPQKVKMPLANKKLVRIRLGEAIHLIRPLIYCLSQIYYGSNSYRPYIISLILDLVRIILQRKVEFYDPKELEEFKLRNKDIIINYLLRNPFYTNILKDRIVIPIMDKLFPGLPFLKKVVLYLLEVRSSLSLLM